MTYITKARLILIPFLLLGITQCEEVEENYRYVPPKPLEINHDNDKYLYKNEGKSVFERYGTTIRWRWHDNFSGGRRYATPLKENLVIPLTQLFEYLWISPYIYGAKDIAQGKAFMDTTLPFEVLYVGSLPYETYGTKGEAAHAVGATRIVFYGLNDYQPSKLQSGLRFVETAHHELTHSIVARYGMPTGFEFISPTYKSNFRNTSVGEAMSLGMVTPYGASSPSEDIAELVAKFLMNSSNGFRREYIDPVRCNNQGERTRLSRLFRNTAPSQQACEEFNKGRQLIKQKIELVDRYYKDIGIDLQTVRDTIQNRINYLRKHSNQIPEE